MTRVLVAKERAAGETRVAATAETVRQLAKAGLQVEVESGAGDGSFIADALYVEAGATIASDAAAAWKAADLVVKVQAPANYDGFGNESELLKEGAAIRAFLSPYGQDDAVRSYARRQITTLPMEFVPRITRAQKMKVNQSKTYR